MPHLEILPPPQRQFWDEQAGRMPPDWVLYGGTAIALRLGHRQSQDFDFFGNAGVDFARLEAALPCLAQATTLRRSPDTLIVVAPLAAGEVRLAFFGGLRFGRVGEPDMPPGKLPIASPLDLLATKLKVLHDRIEPKDYLDVEALLRAGLTLDAGIAAAMTLFGPQLNPLDTAKTLAWFRDGDLERLLPERTRRFLTAAAADFDPATAPVALVSTRLVGK